MEETDEFQRVIVFALISLALGPSEERERNLERIREICEASS